MQRVFFSFLCVCLSFIYLFFLLGILPKPLTCKLPLLATDTVTARLDQTAQKSYRLILDSQRVAEIRGWSEHFFHVEYIVTPSLTAVSLANVLLGWCKSSKGIQVVGSTEINMVNIRARIDSLLVPGMTFSEVRCLWDELHFT